MSALTPLERSERIEAVDVLRGVAILGILPVNMLGFAAPVYVQLAGLEWWTSAADRWAMRAIHFFVAGKFYSLFAFLFGLGLALQLERAGARGARFAPVYTRRLAVLLVIGVAHACLLWWGDVLHIYAVLGFFLFAFRASSARTLVMAAVVSLSIRAQIAILETVSAELGASEMSTAGPGAGRESAAYQAAAEKAVNAYQSGSVAAIVEQRTRELGAQYARTALMLPHVFAIFLAGLCAGRAGVFRDLDAHRRRIRKALWWGLGLGLSGNIVFAASQELSNPLAPSWTLALGGVCYVVGAPALACFYATSVVLLHQRRGWRRIFAPLAAVGRTALSNYLFQSLVCTTLFYGYGFGLYGRIGPAEGLLLSAAVFLVQAPLSVWWLRRFRFGPAEWLWRSATYLELQPMRERV